VLCQDAERHKNSYPAWKSAKVQHFQQPCANFSLFTHTTCIRNALISQEHRTHPSILGHLIPVITSSGLDTQKKQLHRKFRVYNKGQYVEKRGLFFTQPLPSTLKHRHRRLSTDPHHHIKQGSRGRGRGGSQRNRFPKPRTVAVNNCNSVY